MPEAAVNPPERRIALRTTLATAGVFGVVLLWVFQQTSGSIVSIWMRSETFAHGFLILPISLWLVWSSRDQLARITPRPAPWVALLAVFPGFAWLVANLVDVLVIQQLALVAMLVVGLWAVLGHALARAMVFPLLFLFLAVPMGEALVPPMMEFTATSTVWLIQQTGVPVFREGLYFTLPTGNWSVVEACSGVRYIIASVTLGLLYAYLTYRSLQRRLLFVLAAAVVPIFANTLRAYIIVMLGHLSGMTVATGVDHLIYGWVFFGLVMFVLFWLGAFFREDQQAALPAEAPLAATGQPVSLSASKLMLSALLALAISAQWSWLAHIAHNRTESAQPGQIALPSPAHQWRTTSRAPWSWQPASAVTGRAEAFYQQDGTTLALIVQYSQPGVTDGEVVGSSARFTEADSGARVLALDKVEARLSDRALLLDQARVDDPDGQFLVWSWYRAGGRYTSNDYLAKFSEALGALGFAAPGAVRLLLVTPMQESVSATTEVLRRFLLAHGSQLDDALEHANSGEP